ncbi:putative coniferyl aldehyde dehydrogenase [Dirofilaria immitis]
MNAVDTDTFVNADAKFVPMVVHQVACCISAYMQIASQEINSLQTFSLENQEMNFPTAQEKKQWLKHYWLDAKINN